MEFPSSIRASTALSLTSSGVNSPDVTPSMRSINGLVTSNEQAVMCSKSFSTVFASPFFMNLDSDAVNISSNFGVLVRSVSGTGYFPRISLLPTLLRVEVMASESKPLVSSDSLAFVIVVGSSESSGSISQSASVIGARSWTVSVRSLHGFAPLFLVELSGSFRLATERSVSGSFRRGDGVLDRLWVTIISSTLLLTFVNSS